ncbi:unnamed protein product [Amoebophrya sp. A120]|nr:unnamed protein product [Amoebophrya sp. A120]|eukprot:GSA120T00002813001.1
MGRHGVICLMGLSLSGHALITAPGRISEALSAI